MKEIGFEFIKLDYLSHGTLEGGSNNGVRFDSSVKTGIQSYNYGMKYVKDRIGEGIFINLSVAPLFPYQYGHARRLSCDSYGSIFETEYVLNSLSYGWWMNSILYEFNDPDHLVFEGHSENENKSRLISGVISGTVFLNGDDLSTATGQNIAKKYLTKKSINDVIRIGKTFVPIEGNTGKNAVDTYTMKNNGDDYIAIFNFTDTSVKKDINLSRAGIMSKENLIATDLWSDVTWNVQEVLNVNLEPREAKLIKVSKD